MAKNISRILAASEDQELDPRYFLGRLATFTLPDAPISGSKLIRLWAKAGLDMALLPDVARQPVHVFQSACGSVRRRRGSNGGARTEVAADEVFHNGTCVYQITVKVWDEAERVIEHEKALRATFDKATSTITFDHLGYTDPVLNQVEADIQAHFDKHAKDVPGQKVRNSVRATLLSIGAQNLRRKAGGLYFVPVQWQSNGHPEATKPVLDGLRDVLNGAYGTEADFYTIPLINDESAQDMVAKHFTLNVRDEAKQIMLDVVERTRAMKAGKGRKIREDALANFYNKRRKLATALKQFDQLVQLERTDIEADLKDLDWALDELSSAKDEV